MEGPHGACDSWTSTCHRIRRCALCSVPPPGPPVCSLLGLLTWGSAAHLSTCQFHLAHFATPRSSRTRRHTALSYPRHPRVPGCHDALRPHTSVPPHCCPLCRNLRGLGGPCPLVIPSSHISPCCPAQSSRFLKQPPPLSRGPPGDRLGTARGLGHGCLSVYPSQGPNSIPLLIPGPRLGLAVTGTPRDWWNGKVYE